MTDFAQPLLEARRPEVFSNLIAGTRLGLFLPVRREDFRFSPDQAALLILVAVVFALGAEYAAVQPVRHFDMDGIGMWAVLHLCYFLAVYLVVRIQGRLSALIPLIVATQSTVLVGAAIYGLLALGGRKFGDGGAGPAAVIAIILISGLYYLWKLAVIYRSIKLVFELDRWGSGFLAVVFFVVLTAPVFVLPTQRLWYSVPAGSEVASGDYRRIDVENVYYDQARLMREALEPLAPGRPGVTDLYFVGFAGWARQDVFFREVRSVKALFDDRFDTKDRSVALINNPETVHDLPLANVNNLRTALGGIGERMDRDEDVLFLFLTSHGSPDVLAVNNWPLRPNNLWAGELRAILDGSGIKWRVVVVSACYSGSFVDELEDDHTLVITASRADRNSFGCGDLNDFTYFGEVYFDQQLRTELSFAAAFDNAIETIAAREAAEGFTPSEPQISMGAAIAPRLEALEARLRASPAEVLAGNEADTDTDIDTDTQLR
jgi:hypothetical protein